MMALRRFLFFIGILYRVVAFAPAPFVVQGRTSNDLNSPLRALERESTASSNDESAVYSLPRGWTMALAGFSMGSFLQAGAALADEVEIAELPPPYVPALFGVVLIAGVGLLTSSLGDVMTEESSLGMQSGARAKKEQERSRSSYFKK